jgi:hypothetical protein
MVAVANEEPPLEAAYHLIPDPVAVKFATVAPVQKLCDADPVGAGEDVIVTEKG